MGEEVISGTAGGPRGRLVVIGQRTTPWRDLYHQALRLSWTRFMASAAAIFLAVNVVFAGLYSLQPSGISEARPGAISDAFFFSVQTLATIGYGRWAPISIYSNTIVTAEVLVGLVLVAVFTGLTFARFARPTAKIAFSRSFVVTQFDGARTLMLRIANERGNQIVEAQVSVAILRDETTVDGVYIRRLHDLRLVRERSPVLGMTFQIMHRIEPDSPLYGYTPARMDEENVEIVVTVSGVDETSMQIVHARAGYASDAVLFDRRYADLFRFLPDGRLAMDFAHFHETLPDTPGP